MSYNLSIDKDANMMIKIATSYKISIVSIYFINKFFSLLKNKKKKKTLGSRSIDSMVWRLVGVIWYHLH